MDMENGCVGEIIISGRTQELGQIVLIIMMFTP